MALKIKITCVVDNSVKISSKLRGEHALSFLVQVGPACILFDTGNSPDILEHNLRELGEDPMRIKHVFLSHGHYDHTGGLGWVISNTRRPTVIADTNLFEKKLIRVEKEFKHIGVTITPEQIMEKADLKLIKDAPYSISQGVAITARIPRVTPVEIITGSKFFIEKELMIEEDQFVDDRAMVIEAEKGVIVIVGCCHSGLINTLTYVQKTYQKPLLAVLGGAHLNEANADRINKTVVAARERFKPQYMYLNHCTGLEPFIALRNSMGAAIKDFPAGSILEF
ncbi:MAG: MBL fold metallo-hydrolase [Anaerolineae bacterium]|nr:MBL fold metallo-hydrolase [Anaerolineae bacterium]